MAHFKTGESGMVSVRDFNYMRKECNLHEVMMLFTDGMSYLNYAMSKSTTGMKNKKDDLKMAHFLFTCAMESLLDVGAETEDDVKEYTKKKKKKKKKEKKWK